MAAQDQRTRFLDTLRELGGSAGNGALRERLGWSGSTYERVQQSLIDDDLIVPERGLRGSIAVARKGTPQPRRNAKTIGDPPPPREKPGAGSTARVNAAERRAAGLPTSQFDAIARAQGASVATRNTSDYDGCGVVVIDPWHKAKGQ